jgi:alpha-tubulin suppressor-like RCC1 family protein
MGGNFACAIDAVTQLTRCWGVNQSYQLDAPLVPMRNIELGFSNACAIETDDTLICWGNQGDGRSSPPGP